MRSRQGKECADMDTRTIPVEVDLHVSQFVKLESAASEGKKSVQDAAAFLLSKWVVPTPAHGTGRRSARRSS